MTAPANTIRHMKPAPDSPTPTPYSRALAEAIRKAKKRHEDLAEPLKVTPGLVSAWVTGRKPVPAKRAKPLADELGNVSPEAISEAYAIIAKQGGANVLSMPGTPALRPELLQSRLENDVDSLRHLVAVLVDVMLRHRPAEASDLLETIQRKVPRKFRDAGFLLELTEAMAARVAAPAKARASAPKRAKPRSA